jgi:hypothetical protein
MGKRNGGDGKNQIMIFGPKNDGTYIIEFKTDRGRGVNDLGAGALIILATVISVVYCV